ncbi:uncharacterized protein LOC134532594 [Bacillus rossius redtenbacheri]|uniref:uncharacterized protein LOC134532594 n=1 Tax=Bacillus rossius redtenbacheri TaxID=93214 RepID=UPI002FDF0599
MESAEPPSGTKRLPWLTEEFLTDVLRKGEDDPGITVEKFLEFTLPKGENYSSFILKLTVTYRDGKGRQLEKPLIIKSIPDNPMMQMFLKEAHLFDKEIYAYRELIPAMKSIAEVPLVSAKFYPTDRSDLVILEDISHLGFKIADRKTRLDLPHASMAIKALARFHGLAYAAVDRDPSLVDHFPESLFSDRAKDMSSLIFTPMFNAVAAAVDTWPGYERFSGKIRSRLDGFMDRLVELVSPAEDGFNVLNHGDFWVNNMLFRRDGSTGEPAEVCVVDLQQVRYGSPALDLQYFLATSLARGVREDHEDELLASYHEALRATLRAAGLGSVRYDLEDLRRDYEAKAEFGLNTGVAMVGMTVAESGDVSGMEDMTEEALRDGAMVNPMEKIFRGKRFQETLQGLLLYYEGKKVI